MRRDFGEAIAHSVDIRVRRRDSPGPGFRVDHDRTRVRRYEACKNARKRGLTGAALADQADRLPSVNVK